MSVLSQLAGALGRRDEIPNQELAQWIVQQKDTEAVRELVENLVNKDKQVQSDCIKVLYEIGERDPQLIADHDKAFIDLLDSKNNRLVWGAMTALDYIASLNPEGIYKHLPRILEAADKGSVITKDHGVHILIQLAAKKEYTTTALSLLLDQLRSCPTNQLPMYAEQAVPVITEPFKKEFSSVFSGRLEEIDKESKRKRIEKVLRKLNGSVNKK